MSNLYVARNPRVAARSLDGEMMIMSGRDSTLFTLNKTATILWQAADGTTPLEQIVQQKICAEFEVEAGDARAKISKAEKTAVGATVGYVQVKLLLHPVNGFRCFL